MADEAEATPSCMLVAAIFMGIFAVYTLKSELAQIIEYETQMEILLMEIFANVTAFQTQEGSDVKIPLNIKDKTKDLLKKQNNLNG